MNRFLTAAVIAVASATSAAAMTDIVTRNAPATMFATPSDLAQIAPGATLEITVGTKAILRADDVLTPRDRAERGLSAEAVVSVTRFGSDDRTSSVDALGSAPGIR